MMFKTLLISITLLTASMSSEEVEILPPIGTETMPIDKTVFKQITDDSEKIVDLTGKDFIVVSVRERGSDGRFYAVDRDGTVWWSGPVTSGAPEFRSPSGIFTIFQKKRYHMSTVYPDESGVNNMDYMMKYTRFGHALHHWSNYQTKVVITRHTYMPFAREDLLKIYGKK